MECSHATEGFSTEKERDRHVDEEHAAYHCLYRGCDFSHKHKDMLKRHIKRLHGREFVRNHGATYELIGELEPLKRKRVVDDDGGGERREVAGEVTVPPSRLGVGDLGRERQGLEGEQLAPRPKQSNACGSELASVTPPIVLGSNPDDVREPAKRQRVTRDDDDDDRMDLEMVEGASAPAKDLVDTGNSGLSLIAPAVVLDPIPAGVQRSLKRKTVAGGRESQEGAGEDIAMALGGAPENQDDSSSVDDAVDDDDWATLGPAVLRKASLPTPGAPRLDYNAMAITTQGPPPSRILSATGGITLTSVARDVAPSLTPIPDDLRALAVYINALPKRMSGFPYRETFKKDLNLRGEVSSKTGRLTVRGVNRKVSKLRPWKGDRRLFGAEMWTWLTTGQGAEDAESSAAEQGNESQPPKRKRAAGDDGDHSQRFNSFPAYMDHLYARPENHLAAQGIVQTEGRGGYDDDLETVQRRIAQSLKETGGLGGLPVKGAWVMSAWGRD